MAKINKTCLSCNNRFLGRKDSKTCSPKCRKRLQRAKAMLLAEAGALRDSVSEAVTEVKNEMVGGLTGRVPIPVAVEAESASDSLDLADSYEELPSAPDLSEPLAADMPTLETHPSELPQVQQQPGTPVPSPTYTVPVKVAPPQAANPLPSPTPQPVQTPATPLRAQSAGQTVPMATPPVGPVEAPKAATPQTIMPMESLEGATVSQLSTPAPVVAQATAAAPSLPRPAAIAPQPVYEQPPRRLSRLTSRPLAAALTAVIMLVLIGGIFLLGSKSNSPINPGSGGNQQNINALQEPGKIILNLDTTVVANKTLTVTKIVPGDNNNLQVAGSLQSQGTLSASNGQSSLDNNGLKINNVLVCTISGCKAGATTSLLTTPAGSITGRLSLVNLPVEVTLQGNSFNGASELVQLDSGGALRVAGSIYQSGNRVCDVSGNCIGLGGAINGAGTPGTIPVFTGPSTIANSNLSQSGATVTASGNLNVTGQYLVNGLQISSTNLSNSASITLQGNSFNGANQLVQLNGSTQLPAVSGVNLTNLNASNIASGTLNDARLSANIAKYNDAAPNFTNNVTAPVFIGNLQGNATTATALQNDPADCAAGSFANAIAANGDLTCSNDGSGLVNVDAATLQGNNAAYFTNASNISSGTLSDARLSANVALLNGTGPQTFTGNNKFTGTFLYQSAANSTSAFQIQNAAGNNNLLIADTLNTRIGIGVASPNYTLDVGGDVNIANNQSYRINGVIICSNTGCTPTGGSNDYIQLQASTPGTQQLGNANISGAFIANSFTGSGLGLTNLDASQLATGTVNDLRLSANVTLQGNSFNGASQLVQTTGLSYLPALNGSLLTNLNASALASGTVNDARLSANVALLNGSNQTFSGTNIFQNAVNITSLTNSNNGFTTTIGFSGTAAGNVTYNFDGAAAAGTYTICTTVGNCSGVGGGVTSLGGTTNQIAKFTGAQTIGDSLIYDNGTNVYIGQTTGVYPLDVVGDINSSTGLRVGGNLLCTAAGCGAVAGSGNYIQNGTGVQTSANYYIRSASINGVTGVVEGANGQLADIFDVQAYNGGTKYLAVGTGGATVAGNLSITGAYQLNGVQITSAVLSNDSNLAKLNGTGPQTFTGDNKFTGTFLVQPASDSTTELLIKTSVGAGGTAVLTADTSNSRVGIGNVTPAYTLDVAGDINIANGQFYRINGVAICGPTASCAPASGSSNYIQNGVALQTNANFNIESTATGSVVGILKGKTGQSADLLQIKDGTASPVTVVSVGANGQTVFKDSSGGNASFFQIQNSSSTPLLTANTTSGQILLPNATLSSTALLLGGNANLYAPSNNNLKTDNNLTVSGNFTGNGTGLFQNTADSTAAFQIQNAAGTSNLFIADTTNSRIGIGASPANSLLTIGTNTTTAAGGVTFGTDTNLYRSAADTLKTDDTFQAAVAVQSPGFDSISGALAIGGTNATTVTLGNTANTTAISLQGTAGATYTIGDTNGTGNMTFGRSTASQTISIAHNTTATGETKTIQIGDSANGTGKSVITIGNLNGASTLTLQGGNTSSAVSIQAATSGTISIGTSNSNNITIGNSAGGTITIGASSGSDLALQDAQWSITGAGLITTADDIAVNGADVTTSSTGTATLFNTNAVTLNIGGAATASGGGINFAGGSGSTGCSINGATGDLACSGNITGSSSGTLGYWSRSGTTLQPATAGDAVTTSGNISTSGSGTITSAGLLTGSAGLTITGGAANINASGTNITNIGNSTGALVLASGGTSSWTNTSGNLTIQTATSGTMLVDSAAALNLGTASSTSTSLGKSGTTLTINPTSWTATPTISGLITATSGLTSNGNVTIQNNSNFDQSSSSGTFATGTGTVSLNGNTTVAATKTFTVTSGLTSLTGNTTGDALNVSNSTSTGNIAVFKDNATAVATIADGGATTFQNSTNSTNGFQVQNAAGNTALNIATSTFPNQVFNSNFENNTNGVIVRGSATMANSSTQVQFGKQSLAVTTTAAAGDGVKFPTSFYSGITYTLSFYLRLSSGTWTNANLLAGRADDGSTETNCTISPVSDPSTSAWTRYSCSFTAGAQSGVPYFYVKQNDATARTFYLDGVQLEAASSASAFNSFNNNLQIDTATNNITLNGAQSGELGAWQYATNSLPAGRVHGMAVTANGYAYVMGGCSATNAAASNNVYYAKLNSDGSVASWTTSSNNLNTAVGNTKAAYYNGYIYIVGGRTTCGGTRSAVVQYAKVNNDGSTSTWNTTTALGTTTSGAGVVANNGYLYIIGGNQAAAGNINTVQYAKINADGTIGSWTSTNSLASTPTAAITAMSTNGYLYASGSGVNQYATINSDGTVGSWATTSSSSSTNGASYFAAVNGYAYIDGNGTGVQYAKLNSDGTLGSFSQTAVNMPLAGSRSQGIAVNGYLYNFGGTSDGTNGQTTVQYVSTPRVISATSLDLVGLNDGNLSQAASGGSLTAGSTRVMGTLDVQAQASFWQSLFLAGSLNSTGSALLQNSSDSSTAFQIQNSSSQNLVAVDTSARTVNIGITGSTAATSTVNIATSSGAAQTVLIGSTNTTSTTTIQSGSGGILLQPLTGSAGNNVVIGASDTTATLLILDTKNNAEASAVALSTCTGAVNGAMYYNSNLNAFRVCQNSNWVNMVSYADIQTFTSNGNWTRPVGVTTVMMIVVGGGGSGAGGDTNSGGSGGGGGAKLEKTVLASDLGTAVGATLPITVGATVTGPSAGNNGAAGNPSCVSSTTACAGTIYGEAYGGGGGKSGGGANRSGGGGGGTAGVGANGSTVDVNGGDPGSDTIAAGKNGFGGAGGGGKNGGDGKSAEYGGGGGAGSVTSGVGQVGGSSIYGGGGGGNGGNDNNAAGGAGGSSGTYTVGGGGSGGTTGGATGGAGGSPSAGTSTLSGSGGGGGGGGSTTGGAGGNGAQPGGGGGAGGQGGTTGGAGGNGGAGEVWMISW